MVLHFESDGTLYRLDTSKADLLMREREVQGRWRELYRTAKGRFVLVRRTLWQGERDSCELLEMAEAVRLLALSDYRTDEGEAVLNEHVHAIAEEA